MLTVGKEGGNFKRLNKMKKVLVLLFAVMATMTVSAQLYVGGSVGFGSAKAENADAVTTYRIMPEIGYNLSESWAIGATLGYEKTGYKTFQIAPYARYTFVNTDLLDLFVDGEVAYMSSKEDVDGADSVNGFGINIKPGLAVNLSENISLIAKYGLLGYNKMDKVSTFGLNLDASKIDFGFIYKF